MAINPQRHYADFYTWSHPLTTGVIAHQDGAVSRLIKWSGLDMDMTTERDKERAWERLYTALNALEVGYCAEFHWWREWDDSLAEKYREQGKAIVRGGLFAHAIRDAQATHLGSFGMSNEVAVVLSKVPKQSTHLLSLFAPKHVLKKQSKEALQLDELARRIAGTLPGGMLGHAAEYCERVQQSYDRDRFERGMPVSLTETALLSETLLPCAPMDTADKEVSTHYLDINGRCSKVLLVYQYPDASPCWFLGMAALPIPVHVVQIVIPLDTRTAMKKSEKESELAEGTLGKRGADRQLSQMQHMNDYRAMVAEHNLKVFYNAYIIHLHGTPDELLTYSRQIKDWIESRNGQVRDQSYIQLPYFRAGQPGQGYRVPRAREDHMLQVANMLPVQVYKSGDSTPESLRLSESGQLVGFNFTQQKIAHSVTVAMTGGGKGVDKVATIAETFPLGIDWYIAEIGQSYRWTVEAFGGTYTRLDPTESVINPLPPYSVAVIPDAEHPQALPLDAFIAGQTINALAFILTDGRTNLSVHEAKAGQDALQYLYALPDQHRASPGLPMYLNALREDLFDNDEQATAARMMANNLESFLGTTEGRIFERDDNLILSQGITGVDLRDVDKANPKLLKFYLVFIALKFTQLAFSRRTPAVALLDEMHKFVAVAPEVIGKLISEIARMGRKDAAAIDIVTQGISEIDVIENEVLNSMRLRSLLYRPDEHEKIANRINMPAGVLNTWMGWKDPTNFSWRPAIRSIGDDYYHLHLTFPDLILDLASSSPKDLTLKDEIARLTKDPFERLKLLKQRRQS